MRKVILSVTAYCIAGTFAVLNSCKKESSQNSSSNTVSTVKVNTWLDEQKQGKFSNKADNIEVLKNNLDFSGLRFERSENEEQFLIIPIDRKFNDVTGIEKTSVTELVLTLNNSGNIRNGNIVLYMSENRPAEEIPHGTFYHIFNTAKPECDGKFRFLSVTGKPLYQVEYKDRRLVSSGIYQLKEHSTNSSSKMVPVCYDVYLVVTYYGESGTIVAQTSQFLYTTCSEDTGGGGGSGGGETVSCCISDPNAQLISRTVSETGSDNCGPETTNKLTGLSTKTCTHIWVFNRSNLLFYSWQYSSLEQVTEEKVGGVWKFKSPPSHSGMNTSGSIPPCISTTVTITAAVPWISSDKSTARMDIYYTQSFSILCIPKVSGGSRNYNGHALCQWNAI